jgi:hypothetical protein
MTIKREINEDPEPLRIEQKLVNETVNTEQFGLKYNS